METNMQLSRLIASAVITLGLVSPVLAEYPERPIKMVVGYSPGGGADKLARPLAEQMSQTLGQNIVFEYKPGAGATIAADYVSRQDPDGYTLHVTDSGPMMIVPHIRKLNYDALTDFAPLGMVGGGGVVVVVPANSPATDLQSLIAMAKKEPINWSYGTSGVGGVGHLAGEQFKSAAGLDITHIAYKGGAPAMKEVLGGHVPFLFSSLGAAAPYIKSGDVRALAVSSSERSSLFPDVPTIAESGFPGFDATIWFGIVAPAGLPPDVEKKLADALAKAMQTQLVQDNVKSLAYEPMIFTPQEMLTRMQNDYAAWGVVVEKAGLAPK
jgi:tripartite-type tricarboxylate transporter receptor subunit TctC